ncbi:hypothetical protein [Amnibacterium sp.]|uniref:hypothetical protein n=1 Tax=Amnibacterium sp. TaxID=1872496 RepID=UPI003F7BD138
MSATATHTVFFVSGSPGPRSEAQELELRLDEGRPPLALVDPLAAFPGEWLLAERVADGLVYRRVEPRTTAP